jgi:hypothetical protein
MSAYEWTCGCTETGKSEAPAQRHAAVCQLLGSPAHPTTCRITMPSEQHGPRRACGLPAVEGALCAKHLADKRANGRGNR